MNVGASFGHVKTDFNAPITFTANNGGGPGSGTTGFAGSDIEHPSGFIGGGQIGYNWQLSPIWVVGFEADIQGALEKDSNRPSRNFDLTFTAPGLIISVGGSQTVDYQTKIDWFGTVRGRLGYLWGDGAVLTYVTGGLAYGEVKINGINTVSLPPVSVTQAFGHSQVNTGWVVGFGTEGKTLIPGLTYKIESLYMDLGTLNFTGSGASPITPIGAGVTLGTTVGLTTHSHFTDGILRAGLNYKFGGPY